MIILFFINVFITQVHIKMAHKRYYETLLSSEEALDFLKDKLGICDFPEQFKIDRKKALNCIIRQYLSTVPFQGATFLATPISERTAPSIEENVQFGLSTEGGRCWTLNSFMCILLDAIGYHVYPIIASVGIRNAPNHAVVIVTNLVKEYDIHLVDVGFGRPVFEAICLDFEGETEVYKHSFDTYKYVKRGEEYIRLQKNDPLGVFPTIEGDFTHAYYFTLEPITFTELQKYMNIYIFIRNQEAFSGSVCA